MGLLPYCHTRLLIWALLLLSSSTEVEGTCSSPSPRRYAALKSGELKDSYPVGTVLQYKCIPGYENIPRVTPSIRCLDNSKWSETLRFCQRRRCHPPHLENGRVESSCNFLLGVEVTFVCEKGYRLIGQKTARCVVSGNTVDWNRDTPYCQLIPCSLPPKITNGGHTGDNEDNYLYGTTVTYKCDSGFALIGKPSITCTTAANGVDRVWSGPAPECKVVHCTIPEIQNGRVASKFQATYTYDDVVVVECDPDCILLGSNFLKCGVDNLWHPAIPKCVNLKSLEYRLSIIEKHLERIIHIMNKRCSSSSEEDDRQ